MAHPAHGVTYPTWTGRKPAESGELRSLGRSFQLNNQGLVYNFYIFIGNIQFARVLRAREAIVITCA